MKKSELTTERKLKLHLIVSLVIYILVGLFIVILLQYVLSAFTNPVVEWLYWRIDVIYFIYLIIGVVCIFIYYWGKPWIYLKEVIDATQTVYEESSDPVALSEPLREVEGQMNQIKMSVLLNQQAVNDAEEKKDELVMCLAHDIRTPLTTIIGYLSLLDETPDIPEAQKEKYIKITLEKAERLETLINELFEITRYHTNTVPLRNETVDLYALLSQVTDEFYPSLSARGNTVKVHVEDNLNVMGDPEKLARVFGNILKNATAYSYPNTEISIYAGKNDKYIMIVFSNRGQTIDEEQLASIFEKFNRLDKARLSDTGGAGLGLSIAKEIVHQHGGEITAQSSNETIAFIITLPLPI